MIHVEQTSVKHLEPNLFDRMYALMHHAYAETEVEIWGENYTRLSREEFADLVNSGTILVAMMEQKVVGSICLNRHSSEHFSFGLLNADFSLSGQGIGRALVQGAEQRAHQLGGKKMTLEILRPEAMVIPQKEQLKAWYERMGYTYTATMRFEELKPDKAEKAKGFIRPCVFDCYEKML